MTVGKQQVVDIDLKHINTTYKRLASGQIKTYRYYRPTGAPLKGEPGQDEFLASYIEAKEAHKKSRNFGTLKAIIQDYQSTSRYRALAPRTKKDYQQQLLKIEHKFGVCPIKALDDPRIRLDFIKWRDSMATKSLRQANYAVTVLGIVLEHGRDMGLIRDNFASKLGTQYKSDRQDKIWLQKDIDAFMAVAPYQMRLALLLALHTGQRQGDIRQLRWVDWNGHTLRIVQSKTGAKVEIPATEALKAALDDAPRTTATILSTPGGMPWSESHFRHKWRDATVAAGIQDLRFQDLRGTAITMFAEAGATTPEIAAVTGHKLSSVNKILETYLSRTFTLAESAMNKFQSNQKTKFANRLQTGAHEE